METAESQGLLEQARQLTDIDDTNTALEVLEDLVQQDPQCVDAYVERMFICWRFSYEEGVVENADRIASIAPESVEDEFGRALVLDFTSHRRAILALGRVILQKPDFERAWYARGSIRNERKEFLGAARDLDQALLLNPHHAFAVYEAGMAKLNLKNYRGAIQDLVDYMRSPMFHDEPQIYQTLGQCMLLMSEQISDQIKRRVSQYGAEEK